MRHKNGLAVAGVVGLAATVIAVPASGADDSVRVIDDVAEALSLPQSASDAPPEPVRLDELGDIIPDSVRLVESDEIGSYWIGQTSSDDICLFVHIPGGVEVAASACASLPQFYQSGLGLTASEGDDDPYRAVEAYLVPDNVDVQEFSIGEEPLGPAAESRIANLIIVPPEHRGTLESTDLPLDSGELFSFTPIPREG
ncbi:hypothetical protein ACPYO6_02890 [Georgenia sp. Z1344]|uniref:hypothetical protein n=1 Tax=Georgenia sp. Z1344 TaxID=3416706 RepID=UPI003CFAF957